MSEAFQKVTVLIECSECGKRFTQDVIYSKYDEQAIDEKAFFAYASVGFREAFTIKTRKINEVKANLEKLFLEHIKTCLSGKQRKET